jgi:hypothetical protein
MSYVERMEKEALDREAKDFTADMDPVKKAEFETYEPKTVNETRE